MSRRSGEPHIAVSILDSVFRIVFLVLTLFLLYEGATKGYWLGMRYLTRPQLRQSREE